MSRAAALVLAGTVPAAVGAQQPVTAAPALVFDGVTVIDVEQGKRLPAQRVVIAGNHIQAVGNARAVKLPAKAQIIDARGKYLIPGLWDMHAHVNEQADQLYPRYIAHGITGLREMAQRFPWDVGQPLPFGIDSFRVWQRAVMAGSRVGPRVFGPSADYAWHFIGPQGNSTEEVVLRTLDSLHARGIIFLKYHDDGGSREMFFAIAREARRLGLPLVGHIPAVVTNVEAADSGLASIEHLQENRQCWPNWADPLGDSAAAEQRCAPVAQAYIRNGTWVVPTFGVEWAQPQPKLRSASLFNDALRLIRMMRRLGVTKFLAGSDWMPEYQNGRASQFFAGLSAAEEVVFFGDAGFTPLQALQTGTLNPAQFFHATDSLGTVAAGKLADLVLLDADPLADISNVLKVWAVVANGRYFDRAALDQLDPEGTKPGVGLIALQRRLDRVRSRNFIADPATAEVELTDDLLTRYIALWKDLTTFWDDHRALRDSATAYADYPVIPVGPVDKSNWVTGEAFNWGDGRQITAFDYVALTAQDSSLAALFKQHGLAPEQFWALQVTLKQASIRRGYTAYLEELGKFAAKNFALVDARKEELYDAGLEF